MREIRFPPVESARPDGLLALSRDIELGHLQAAYRSGVFPWPVDDGGVLWFAPPRRALLFFERLHVPRRLARSLGSAGFEFRFDTAFEEVIGPPAGAKFSSAAEFKVGARRDLINRGYNIVAAVGDQASDLNGGFAERVYKLPNPLYVIR